MRGSEPGQLYAEGELVPMRPARLSNFAILRAPYACLSSKDFRVWKPLGLSRVLTLEALPREEALRSCAVFGTFLVTSKFSCSWTLEFRRSEAALSLALGGPRNPPSQPLSSFVSPLPLAKKGQGSIRSNGML